eukprot:7153477-Pyramimonas_sp.AAC.1
MPVSSDHSSPRFSGLPNASSSAWPNAQNWPRAHARRMRTATMTSRNFLALSLIHISEPTRPEPI